MALHANPQQFILPAVAAAAVTAYFVWSKKRKRASEEEREHLRRQHLTLSGRIIDGTLLGIDDPEGERARHPDGPQLLYYSYEISGVVYESSQDVRSLQELIDPEVCRLASAISVRYDPRNHANSIIVAESWTGLRRQPRRRLAIDEEAVETQKA